MSLTAKTMCDSWFILKTICEEFKDYLCVPVTSEPLLLSGGSRCKPSCLLIRIQSTAKINQRNQLMHLIKLKDINRISCFIFYHDFKKILLFLQWQRNWQRCSTSHSYVLCMSLGTVKEKHITDFLWTFNEEIHYQTENNEGFHFSIYNNYCDVNEMTVWKCKLPFLCCSPITLMCWKIHIYTI